jgi:hypothetical protein
MKKSDYIDEKLHSYPQNEGSNKTQTDDDVDDNVKVSLMRGLLVVEFKSLPLRANGFVDIQKALNWCGENDWISVSVKDAWFRNKDLLSLSLSPREFSKSVWKTQEFWHNSWVINDPIICDYRWKKTFHPFFMFIFLALALSALGLVAVKQKKDFAAELSFMGVLLGFVALISHLYCTDMEPSQSIKLGIYGKTLDTYCKKLYKELYESFVLRESGLPEVILDIIEDYITDSPYTLSP